jgi:WD40 repeat protein
MSPPLLHQAKVSAVAWSPDGTRLVTASLNVVRMWDVSWSTGALDEWRAMLERCPYQLNTDGAVVARSPEPVGSGSKEAPVR